MSQRTVAEILEDLRDRSIESVDVVHDLGLQHGRAGTGLGDNLDDEFDYEPER